MGGQACFGVALWSNLPVVLPIKMLEVGTTCLLLLPFATDAKGKSCPSLGHGLPFALVPFAHESTLPEIVPALQLTVVCPVSALLKNCLLPIPTS